VDKLPNLVDMLKLMEKVIMVKMVMKEKEVEEVMVVRMMVKLSVVEEVAVVPLVSVVVQEKVERVEKVNPQ
jgi:hypothetical protein